MSGQSFNQFNVDWLNVSPAGIDTSTELSKKWNSVNPVVAIGKLALQINVPAFAIDFSGVINTFIGNKGGPFVVGQLNYSFPSAFTLTVPRNYNIITNDANEYVGVIRFQKGSKTTRYVLNVANAAVLFFTGGQPYAGQVIQPNFVIELWAGIQLAEVVPVTDNGYLFNTSILFNPSTAPQGNPYVNPAVMVPLTDLFTPFPLTPTTVLPTDGPWLSN